MHMMVDGGIILQILFEKHPFIFRGNRPTGFTQQPRNGVVSTLCLPEKPQTRLRDHVRTGTADIAVKMDVRET